MKLLSFVPTRQPLKWGAAFLLMLTLAACKREDVKVYRVAKDDSNPPAVQTPSANQMTTENSQPSLQFILPNGWTQIAPSQMRVASFSVTNASGPAADVGVIPLPAGEDELALVNMWRDQMQLPALTNAAAAQTVSVGNDSAKLFEIASEQPLIDGKFRARILVVELTRGATSWFFKLTGESDFVAAQKENFLQFLKSVSFVESAPAQTASPNLIENQNGGSNVNSIWTIPSGWKSVAPSQFLLAEFLIETNGAQADVNVAELSGEGGGLLANVNRWRGQLGLSPATDADLNTLVATMDSPNGKIQIVDLSGTDAKTSKPARLVGAVVPQAAQTWFYKLMGDEKIVAAQRAAFIKFVQSAKY